MKYDIIFIPVDAGKVRGCQKEGGGPKQQQH